MGKVVSIADAKTRVSELLARAEAGEEIVIARDDRPVVRLAPVESPPSKAAHPRQPGLAKHWLNDPEWERLNRLLLEPMNEEDVAIAEGQHHDEDCLMTRSSKAAGTDW